MTAAARSPVAAPAAGGGLRALLPRPARWLAVRGVDLAADHPGSPTRLRDAAFLARLHRRRVGHWPRILAPRSFNEWILHRLVVARDPLHRLWNDKLAMRGWVAARIGPGQDVPVLAAVDDPADIPWESLPRGVVVKATHGSRWNLFLPDAAAADRSAVVETARSWLAHSYDEVSRELGYRGVPRRILVEPLLPAGDGFETPLNVKAFVFGGRIAMIHQLGRPVGGQTVLDAYGPDWRLLPLRCQWPPLGLPPLPPAARATLADFAARIGAGVDFMRLDLLWDEPRQRLLVGEVTPYPQAGSGGFDPIAWDFWLGGVWRATRAGLPWPAMPG
jgi:hypothetical protein